MGLVSVGSFSTRAEAEIVQGRLAASGIESTIEADDAGGAYNVLSGSAYVLVDESDRKAASEILGQTEGA
jgi:cell division protein FtsN